ncbi:YdcF family protein [Rapidithrix thailandica]|uniref:YdcF family protein n=1 Tax=Rapidithrix thailandica TaxID=413964 RepID=A0AAW9S7Y6_9BACT
MLYFLSKTLDFVLLPFSWAIIFLLLALFTKKAFRRKLFIGLSLLVLILGGNAPLVNRMMLVWEVPPTPISSLEGPYDFGLILTGVTNNYKGPGDRLHFRRNADRVLHAALLYRKGIVKKLLITGGYKPVFGKQLDEAASIKHFLIDWGIPEKDIVLESESRNTYESAVKTKALLDRQYPETGPSIIITSGFHMRRSIACFEQAGMEVLPFSAGFYTSDPDYPEERPVDPFMSLIPEAGAFQTFSILCREIMGYGIYKLLGRI